MRFAQEISIFNPHAIEMVVTELGTRITQTAEEIRIEAAQTLSNYSTTEQMNAAISVKADEIASEVSETYATQQSVNSSVSSLSSRITQNANSISSEVTARKNADTAMSSRINQSAHSIAMSVSGKAGKTGTGASITITLKDANGNNLSSGSGNILIDGNVVFSSQLTDGVTRISGNNITTGTIKDANSNTTFNLSTGALTIKKGSINLGSGNFSVTDAGILTIKRGSINLGSGKFVVTDAGALTATNASIKGTISSSTISGSTITVGDASNNTMRLYINGSTGNVWANNLNIMTGDGYPIGGWYQDGDTEGNATQDGHWMRLWTGHGLKISGERGEWFKCATYAVFTTHAYFRAEVFNANGDVQFYSDRKTKQDIVPLDMQKSVNTIMALKPVRYRYKTSPDVVRHGFIAQDVQNAVSDDWGVVGECVDPTTHEKTLTLKYTELIADLVATVQSQDKRIKALEAQHG